MGGGGPLGPRARQARVATELGGTARGHGRGVGRRKGEGTRLGCGPQLVALLGFDVEGSIDFPAAAWGGRERAGDGGMVSVSRPALPLGGAWRGRE
jgi:hypothetical protein